MGKRNETERRLGWALTLISSDCPIARKENGEAIRGAERALKNRGIDLGEHLDGPGGYDWQSLTVALGVEREYFEHCGLEWGGE